MKRAVSVSIGSSNRDKAIDLELLDEKVRIERIGTDGDMKKAARLFKELDGEVDALGLGGGDFGTLFDGKYFRYYNVEWIAKDAKKTPVVDGSGLRNTLESWVGEYVEEHIGDFIKPKRILFPAASDRWGMTKSFLDLGYECIFGELMFGLGIPVPLRSVRLLKVLATAACPIIFRLPFEWIYPIGKKQNLRKPRFKNYYRWATIIAGDRHFIVRHMPKRLDGKVIVTNTTTPGDIELFRDAGIKYLTTTTPAVDGRSFGTNMMEAALVAVAGKGRALTDDELSEMIDRLGLEPQIQKLN